MMNISISGLFILYLLHIYEEVNRINDSDIDIIHYDVVDEEFNNCFIFRDIVLEKIKGICKRISEVHFGVLK